MLSIYAELSSHLAVPKGKAAAHMQGTVFTLVRWKIVPTLKNLCHIQCQCVDEFVLFSLSR